MDSRNKPSGSKPSTTTNKKEKRPAPFVSPVTTVVQTFPAPVDLEPLTKLSNPRDQYPGFDAISGSRGDKTLFKNLSTVNANRDRISVSYKTAYSVTAERELDYEPLGGVFIEGPHCKTSLPAASRKDRKANIFSSDALRELIISRLLSGHLILLPISTKGGSPRDTVMCLVSSIRKGRAEVGFGGKSLAMQEYKAWYETLTDEERKRMVKHSVEKKTGVVKWRPEVTPPNQIDSLKVQLSHLIWRYTHRELIDGEYVCRQIPCIGEVSHMAERYHYCEATLAWPEIDHKLLKRNELLTSISSMMQYHPLPSFTPFQDKGGWYYHQVNMESHVWNEFRKDCARFGLAVRKASTGEFYAPGEDSDEPSMCPHEQMGCPCFMPPQCVGSSVQSSFIPSRNDATITPGGGLSFKKRRVSVTRDHGDIRRLLHTPEGLHVSTFPGLSTLMNHATPSYPHTAGPAESPGIITYSPSHATVQHPHACSSIDQQLSPDLRVAIANIEDMVPPPDDCRQPLNVLQIDDDDSWDDDSDETP